MNTKTKELTLIGLMAALTCIAGPLSLPLPFSPVPISLTNLAIYFSVYILGMKRGTISYLVYLLLGLVGLPVFSAFTSGPAKLFGPTGGYLIGFIFIALISGYCVDRWNGRFVASFLGMAAGTAWQPEQEQRANLKSQSELKACLPCTLHSTKADVLNLPKH